jgi:hypothetical protein
MQEDIYCHGNAHDRMQASSHSASIVPKNIYDAIMKKTKTALIKKAFGRIPENPLKSPRLFTTLSFSLSSSMVRTQVSIEQLA